MIIELKNEFITAKISTLGAELKSLCLNGKEYLWQGNPEFWRGQAPVLFPVVARNLNNEITVGGSSYPMPKHGLARTTEFEAESISDISCTLLFRSNEVTKKSYPFDFEFRVKYTIDGKKLIQSFETTNIGANALYYCVGGHPALSIPNSTFDSWEIAFDKDEPLNSLMVTPDIFIDGSTTFPVEHTKGVFALTRDLFKYDTLIFENLTSSTVTLRTKDGLHGASVDFSEFPSIALWTLMKDGADYVCLEPWQGMGQRTGETSSLENRHDVIRLESGTASTKTFSIELF